MEIRTLRVDEIDAVINLLKIELGDSVESPAQIRRFLQRDPEISLVALENEEVVGVCLSGETAVRGLLHRLVVDRSHRRKGIAAALVNKTLSYFRAIPEIKMVFVRVYCHNHAIKEFFLKQGFRLSSRPEGEGVIDAMTYFF
jgi:ribosomal protein S18 acetylase RimI-like enzyme